MSESLDQARMHRRPDIEDPRDLFSFGSDLLETISRLKRILRRAIKYEIPVSHVSILSTLDLYGNLNLKELCTLERITPSSATPIITCLKERGLISTFPDGQDKRKTVADITERGRELLRGIRNSRSSELNRWLKKLDDDEISNLYRGLVAIKKIVLIGEASGEDRTRT